MICSGWKARREGAEHRNSGIEPPVQNQIADEMEAKS
jgi:hypothetical protein